MADNPAIPKLVRSTTLHYFSEVAERGSFRAAAETLHIAASAINRQVSNLEVSLGAKLFERARGRSGLQLTEAGRILQLRLRLAINELRNASDEIEALQGLRSGHVTIGVSEGIISSLLSDAISEFQQKYRNITFRIEIDSTSNIVLRLKGGAIDFAIVRDATSDEEFIFMQSISLGLYAVVSVDHFLARQPFVGLAELGRFDLVMSEGTRLFRQIIAPEIRSSSVQFKPIVETNSFELIYSLAERGVGVGIVTGREPKWEGHRRLVHVEIHDTLLAHNVVACCRMPDRSLSAAAEAFAGTICKALKVWETRQSGPTREAGSALLAASGA